MESLAVKQDPVAAHIALIAAATAGVVAQGGFYLPGRMLVTALAAVAFGLTLHVRRDLLTGLVPILGTAGAIVAWALLRGVPSGGLPVAAAVTASLATLVAGLAVVRLTGPAARRWLMSALVGIGTLVAVTGWAGVAWRLERWSVLVESTLWRAASTLTYSNAAAAILAVAALLALALTVEDPGVWWRPCAVYLTQVGLAATLSRAGALAFAVGLVVLAVAAGPRAVLRHAAAAGLGAGIALAALIPSFPADASPQPLLAIGGLLAGAVVAVLLPRLHPYALLAACTVLAAAALVSLRYVSGLDALLARRATLASRGRSGATSSALDLVAAHPVTGSGPGRGRYFWIDHTGQLVVSRWVHNEYLQWLVDLGAIGLVLLLAFGAALILHMRRGRQPGAALPLWAGAVAAIAALALHSAFDFLWELAVVPLLVGVLVGIAGPSHGEDPAPQQHGEEQS